VNDVEERNQEKTWMIEGLWLLDGVGIVGGTPKTLKTWLSAEVALAVASGSPAFGRFAARAKGPVLFFGAEDEPALLRQRFESLAKARGLSIKDVPLYLLDVSQLRLDKTEHVHRLANTVEGLKPRLVILDPFVRLAQVDENSASEVSAVLGALRAIQRQFHVAVLLVHHMRKSSSAHIGNRLRGSGDFAAWSDSAMYLMKKNGHVRCVVEHRSASAPDPFDFELSTEPTPHLRLVGDFTGTSAAPASTEDVILQRLAVRPYTTVELRDAIKIRKATLIDKLEQLKNHHLVVRSDHGWTLAVQLT